MKKASVEEPQMNQITQTDLSVEEERGGWEAIRANLTERPLQ